LRVTNADSYSDGDGCSIGNSNSDGDGHGCGIGNSNGDGNCDVNDSSGNSNANGHSDRDAHAAAYWNAETGSDTADSPDDHANALAAADATLIGTIQAGTREQNSRVPRL
jgi:hypothetical protein